MNEKTTNYRISGGNGPINNIVNMSIYIMSIFINDVVYWEISGKTFFPLLAWPYSLVLVEKTSH